MKLYVLSLTYLALIFYADSDYFAFVDLVGQVYQTITTISRENFSKYFEKQVIYLFLYMIHITISMTSFLITMLIKPDSLDFHRVTWA